MKTFKVHTILNFLRVMFTILILLAYIPVLIMSGLSVSQLYILSPGVELTLFIIGLFLWIGAAVFFLIWSNNTPWMYTREKMVKKIKELECQINRFQHRNAFLSSKAMEHFGITPDEMDKTV